MDFVHPPPWWFDNRLLPTLGSFISEPDVRLSAGVFDRVSTVLARLPPKERDVVTLYHIHEKPQETIAKLLGISQQAVCHRLHMAYRRLLALMEQPDMDVCQMQRDLTRLVPTLSPSDLDVLRLWVLSGSQVSAARQTGRAPCLVCELIWSTLHSLRESTDLDAAWYRTCFEWLLTHQRLFQGTAPLTSNARPRAAATA